VHIHPKAFIIQGMGRDNIVNWVAESITPVSLGLTYFRM